MRCLLDDFQLWLEKGPETKEMAWGLESQEKDRTGQQADPGKAADGSEVLR